MTSRGIIFAFLISVLAPLFLSLGSVAHDLNRSGRERVGRAIWQEPIASGFNRKACGVSMPEALALPQSNGLEDPEGTRSQRFTEVKT